jgi:hypothetical protein
MHGTFPYAEMGFEITPCELDLSAANDDLSV